MATRKSKTIKINLGSGITLLPGFINVDKYYTAEQLRTHEGIFKNAKWPKGARYVQGDILALPFHDDYADYIECIDVIEHIPMRQVSKAMSEIFRILKPGGKLFLMTTDFDDLACLWLTQVAGKPFNVKLYQNVAEMIYGNQQAEGEFHKTPFTSALLEGLLQDAGFFSFTIVRHPRGSRGPKVARDHFLYGLRDRNNRVMRSDMLAVEAEKPGDIRKHLLPT